MRFAGLTTLIVSRFHFFPFRVKSTRKARICGERRVIDAGIGRSDTVFLEWYWRICARRSWTPQRGSARNRMSAVAYSRCVRRVELLYVTYSPGPNPGFKVEHELQRWLAVNPRSTAAAGFRAGWARMAKLISPRLREWEARWWRSVRDNDRIRARLGNALRELARLQDRG